MPYLGQQDRALPYRSPDLISREEVVGYPTNFSPMSQANIDQLSRRGEQLTHIVIERWIAGLCAESRTRFAVPGVRRVRNCSAGYEPVLRGGLR